MKGSIAICAFAIVCIIFCGVQASSTPNLRPIVGILDQPYKSDDSPLSYIAASYVKYLESAGARVVPVFYNQSKEEIKTLMGQINGIIFPGGGSGLNGTPLFHTAQYIYQLALEMNDRGIHFPIFGHCMGFQLLSMITSQDMNILEPAEAEDVGLPLNFTKDAPSSVMFGQAPKDIISILATEPVTMNYHHWGIGVDRYLRNKNLANFYNILSVNDDNKGLTFVSSVEGKHYPIFGLQWHPEKNAFEWSGHINHSPSGIRAMQYMADFTVGEARKNFNHFNNPDIEYSSLIYNYCPTYTAKTSSSFVQSYIFGKK